MSGLLAFVLVRHKRERASNGASVKQTTRDQDDDGLQNLGEFRSETDPLDDDADDDGLEDDDEYEVGDEDNVCTTDDLQLGTVVHEAEIENGVSGRKL